MPPTECSCLRETSCLSSHIAVWAPSLSGVLWEFQQWIRRNVRMLEVFPQWSFNETHQIWMRTEKYGLAGICPTGDSRVVWWGRWRAAELKISIPKPLLAEWNNDTCFQTDKCQRSINRMWKLVWINRILNLNLNMRMWSESKNMLPKQPNLMKASLRTLTSI